MKRSLQLLAATLLGGLSIFPFGAQAQAQAPSPTLEVILAIDTSASMRPALDAAKKSANEFVALMPPDVAIGVETFSSTARVLTSPTTDRTLITDQIDSIEALGDTALYDVVVAASQHFTPTVEHKVLVLLSDGKDEGSIATLDDAIAASQGVQVESISLTTPESDLASLLALGPVTSADDNAGVWSAFARIADLLIEVISTTAPTPTTAPPTTTPPTSAPATTVAATSTVAVVETPPPPPQAPQPAVSASAEPPTGLLWVGAAGVFLGLFALAMLLWPQDRVSKVRLGTAKPRSIADIGSRTTTAIEDALERHGKRTDLGTALAVADISLKPAEFVAMVALVAFVAGLVGLVLGGPVIALLVFVATCVAARFYVSGTKSKRQGSFADQLPDVLQLVTTALRSGYGLVPALESVAEEAEEPARSEFAHVLVESRLGRDLSDAMHALADRMESQDLEWVVSAIDINRETGGNLSEILHQVGVTIRERGRMARNVRTLTAEGRLSARILTGLPLLLLLWQWRVNPDNFALLTEGAGLIALGFAGVLIVIGSTWVNKIAKSVAL